MFKMFIDYFWTTWRHEVILKEYQLFKVYSLRHKCLFTDVRCVGLIWLVHLLLTRNYQIFSDLVSTEIKTGISRFGYGKGWFNYPGLESKSAWQTTIPIIWLLHLIDSQWLNLGVLFTKKVKLDRWLDNLGYLTE